MVRYTKKRPCPICGGHQNDDRGNGTRCYGFLSDDEKYARCTRPEEAGLLPLEEKTNSYRHYLAGVCFCGETHGDYVLPLNGHNGHNGWNKKTGFRSNGPLVEFPEGTVRYQYTDEHGKLISEVIRKPDKKFLVRRYNVNGWPIWGLRDETRRVLWRLPKVIAAVEAGETIWLAEGEKDVIALANAGVTATCNSGGAGKWLPEHTESLRGAAEVIIVADRDDGEGRMHAEKVKADLAPAVGAVRVVEAAEGKDAHDHLVTHGLSLEEFRDVDLTNTKRAVLPEEVVQGARAAFTDSGNALRFLEDHSERLRYAEGPGYYEWTGQRWACIGAEEPLKYAKQTARKIRQEAVAIDNRRTAEQALSHAHRSEGSTALNAMLKLAGAGDLESEFDLRVSVDDFDGDPEVLNTPDGLINLRTGRPVDGSAKDYLCTHMTRASFDPDADMTEWTQFLTRILPPEDVRKSLQRCMGAGATGHAAKALFIMYGPKGDNGKTQLIEAVNWVLGSYAGTALESTFTNARATEAQYDLAELRGKRWVAFSETREGHGLAAERVKRATGLDTMGARSPYGRPFSYKATYNLWVATNHRPKIPAGEGAMWNRIWLFHFGVKIPKSEQVEAYGTQLAREHGPAILRWLVEGAGAYLAAGLKFGSQPLTVQKQVDEWRDRDDLVRRWVSERTEESRGRERFPACFTDFQRWLGDESELDALREYTASKFHQELDDYYARSEKPSGGYFHRLGMRLKPWPR